MRRRASFKSTCLCVACWRGKFIIHLVSFTFNLASNKTPTFYLTIPNTHYCNNKRQGYLQKAGDSWYYLRIFVYWDTASWSPADLISLWAEVDLELLILIPLPNCWNFKHVSLYTVHVVLEMELKAVQRTGKYCINWAMSPKLKMLLATSLKMNIKLYFLVIEYLLMHSSYNR